MTDQAWHERTAEATRGGRPEGLLAAVYPLAGAAFAVLDVAADLTIDKFPDEHTPVGRLAGYYAAHHTQVRVGGELAAYAAVFLGLFGVALWARIRGSGAHPMLAGTALVGTVVGVVALTASASTYATLGAVGARSSTDPAALQAWHIAGATGWTAPAGVLLALAVALATFTAGSFARWVGWTALVLAAVGLVPGPLSFLLGLVLFHLWALAVGVAMALRPRPTDAATVAG